MNPAHARSLGTLGLLGCCAILLVAFWYQFRLGEMPCPLCLLQRAAFAAAGVGFALTVRFGPRPSHLGVTILSAVAGSFVSARQVALHIVPGTGGYGSTLFGLHFYTLALIAFLALIVAAAALLLADGAFRAGAGAGAWTGTGQAGIGHVGTGRAGTVQAGTAGGLAGTGALGWACLLLFLSVVLANALATAAECGGGLCPDDPVGYEALDAWLGRAKP
ncbi:disulfide bond formation protein B [Methylobacterium sp. NEAU 140]|uniref:disulfide bond formation protein B n=1 Tax=Methylobacterium sp. NEAU 140 TaxID=3064945 RepID=UPI00273717DD|nr:disulfide bond formation protein B [Methylobacterium sp. NEAU 140]MDP4025275.1 disulfide bond formation protein B [Methylobacterium sp. NEAU 140]